MRAIVPNGVRYTYTKPLVIIAVQRYVRGLVMKIDKGIPLRPRDLSGGRKYPFNAMDVGDSIWVERARAESAKVCAIIHGKRFGKRFSAREEGAGRRKWRIA